MHERGESTPAVTMRRELAAKRQGLVLCRYRSLRGSPSALADSGPTTEGTLSQVLLSAGADYNIRESVPCALSRHRVPTKCRPGRRTRDARLRGIVVRRGPATDRAT